MKLTHLRTAPVRIAQSQSGWTDALLPAHFYAEVDGLVITEWEARPADPWARFGLTHVESGTRLGEWLYTKRETAEQALARVATLLPWSDPLDALRAELELRSLIDPTLPARLRRALAPRGTRVPT